MEQLYKFTSKIVTNSFFVFPVVFSCLNKYRSNTSRCCYSIVILMVELLQVRDSALWFVCVIAVCCGCCSWRVANNYKRTCVLFCSCFFRICWCFCCFCCCCCCRCRCCCCCCLCRFCKLSLSLFQQFLCLFELRLFYFFLFRLSLFLCFCFLHRFEHFLVNKQRNVQIFFKTVQQKKNKTSREDVNQRQSSTPINTNTPNNSRNNDNSQTTTATTTTATTTTTTIIDSNQ